MTEKRFQYNVNKNTIEQDGKFVAYVNSVDGVRIANKLNVFQKENEQLKQFKEKVYFLFDNEIARNEEAIEWGKEVGGDSGAIGFYNHMLKMLKKELKE